jgi:hypothetical protein
MLRHGMDWGGEERSFLEEEEEEEEERVLISRDFVCSSSASSYLPCVS